MSDSQGILECPPSQVPKAPLIDGTLDVLVTFVVSVGQFRARRVSPAWACLKRGEPRGPMAEICAHRCPLLAKRLPKRLPTAHVTRTTSVVCQEGHGSLGPTSQKLGSPSLLALPKPDSSRLLKTNPECPLRVPGRGFLVMSDQN